MPVGKGEILFCQLKVRKRMEVGSAAYDPAAERLLINLLTRPCARKPTAK